MPTKKRVRPPKSPVYSKRQAEDRKRAYYAAVLTRLGLWQQQKVERT